MGNEIVEVEVEVGTFEWALYGLKKGMAMTRSSWDPINYIEIHKDAGYILFSFPRNNNNIPNNLFYDYMPTQRDILAKDWVVYE